MEYLGVIPARYRSSRFPGKPLVNILGKPLVIHVAEKAVAALGHENVVVATEDLRIFDEVEKWGFKAIMTTDKPLTGTDRIWEVAQQIKADFYINIQGDEPMVSPEDVKAILEARRVHPDMIVNGYSALLPQEDPHSVNIPKVVFSESGRLLYMSRAAIPGIKGTDEIPVYHKQVSIYAFNYAELEAFGNRTEKTPLEHFEDIEILRFAEMDYPIQMVPISGNSLAVDEPGDVAIVEAAINKLNA